MAKSNESLSLPKKKLIHGVEVKKMPNGQYLKALELIKELPESFMKELMEGKTDMKLSDMFDIQNLATMAGTLLTLAPSFTIRFLAKLLNVKESVFENELTPLETIEVVEKFWEINNLTSFFQKMKPIMRKVMSTSNLIGFKEQSQSVSKSE